MLMVFLQVSRSSAQRKKLSLSLVDYTAIQNFNINPIQDGEGGGQTSPPLATSFSPVTSTNVRISPQNFLTFSFNPFVTLLQNFKFAPSASPKLLNLNQDHPSRKAIFLVKSLQNWGYYNFSHRNAAVTKLWSYDHIYNIIWITW